MSGENGICIFTWFHTRDCPQIFERIGPKKEHAHEIVAKAEDPNLGGKGICVRDKGAKSGRKRGVFLYEAGGTYKNVDRYEVQYKALPV